MIEISPHSHVHIPPFLLEKEGSLNLLIHPERPIWMVVNDVGLEIMKLGQEELTLSEICKIISSRYGVGTEKIEQDAFNFVRELDHADFLGDPKAPNYRPYLKSLFLHLTYRCNLACKHCYVGGSNDNEAEMGIDTIFSLIDQLVSQGGEAITISGGEPLFKKDIKKILSYAAERLTITVLTNGTLINRSLADFMVGLGIKIQVSLDGSNTSIHDSIRGKGSFARAMEGIRLLKESGIGGKLNLCTTIMKDNIGDVPRVIELADKVGIEYVRFLALRRIGRARELWYEINADVGTEDYERLYEYILFQAMREYPSLEISSGLSGFVLSAPKGEPSGTWCPIGKNLVITASGDCYPCVLFMSDKYHLGNVKEATLLQIWKSPILEELVDSLGQRRSVIERCEGCSWRSLCQGGCMGTANEWKGTIWDTDRFCAFRKKLYRKTIFELASKKSSIIAKSEDCF